MPCFTYLIATVIFSIFGAGELTPALKLEMQNNCSRNRVKFEVKKTIQGIDFDTILLPGAVCKISIKKGNLLRLIAYQLDFKNEYQEKKEEPQNIKRMKDVKPKHYFFNGDYYFYPVRKNRNLVFTYQCNAVRA